MSTERPDRPVEEDVPGSGSSWFVERTLSQFIKRVVESGVEKIAEGPENLRQFVHDLKVPKEIATYLLVQIDETKNGLYRVVAKEIRDFLEHTNVSEELTRALTRLSFEIKTEIRFIPNDAAGTGDPGKFPKPDVRASVHLRSDRKSERPPKPHGDKAQGE